MATEIRLRAALNGVRPREEAKKPRRRAGAEE